MVQDIYDPLLEYVRVFHDRFKEVSEETFAELAKEAQVDVEANRETCRLYTPRRRVPIKCRQESAGGLCGASPFGYALRVE